MPQLSVRFPDEFVTLLDQRGDKATVIRESLDRYFSILSRARASLRGMFSEPEIGLLSDVSNGVLYEAWSIPHMSAGMADAVILDGVDEKWGVDGPVLLGKLRGLDDAQTFALVDALERFWVSAQAGGGRSSNDLLQ